MRHTLLLAALLTPAAASAEKEPVVRVRVVYTLPEIRFTPSHAYAAESEEMAVREVEGGREYVLLARDGEVELADRETSTTIVSAKTLTLEPPRKDSNLLVKQVPYGIGWWWGGSEDRLYEGRIQARVNAEGNLDLVVALPLEEYLRGVVPSEIGGDAPAEALKAQAVAARSETVTALRKGAYKGEGYDICADVECQVYSGIGKRTAATDAAIKATRGLVLTHGGETLSAFYASNCGGWSEPAHLVWPGRTEEVPYWSSNPDTSATMTMDLSQEEAVRAWVMSEPEVFCNPLVSDGLPKWAMRNFRWKVETTAEELTARVASKKDIGRIVAIKPGKRGPSGRLTEATFVGENGEITVGPELTIRQIWDPPLRSACFVVDTVGDPERPEKFVMQGAGWGHGVGMCQTGAIARSLAGQSFRDILAHYYRETEVQAAFE